MLLKKFYRNPEVIRIIKRLFLVFILFIVLAVASIYYFTQEFNRVLYKQNISILSNIDNEGELGDIIKNFYNEASEEDISSGIEILKQYGYTEALNINDNYILKQFYNRLLMVIITECVLFAIIVYFTIIREYKKIFIDISRISEKTSAMHKGKYERIDGDKNEGEISILIDDLNIMGERVNNSIELLNKEKEYLKDFLSDISHQLKTPLSSLVMFNDLMLGNEDMPLEQRKVFLKKSEEQLRKMEWLIYNLLKLGRLEASAIDFNLEKRDIGSTIKYAISSLEHMAKKRDINLKIIGDLDVEFLHDSDWLGESLSNIIKNGIEHTPNGGNVIVKVEKGTALIKIIVEDNGNGIPKDMIKNIFKRFYKGNQNSTNPESIGIGLYLSKSIIEKMGGDINVISEVNKGTKFIINFLLNPI